MNIENFSSFLENPSQLYQLPYQELKSLVLQYPFSANLRLLLLQKSKMENHREYEQNLRMAATFSINRAHLKQQIEKIEGLTKPKDNVLLQEDFLELKDLSALHNEPQKELIEIDLGEKGEKPKDTIAFNIPNDSGDITTEQEDNILGNLVTDDHPEMDIEDSNFLLEELLNDREENGEITHNESSNQTNDDHVLEWEIQEGGQAEDKDAFGSEGEANNLFLPEEENFSTKTISENFENKEDVLNDSTVILDGIIASAVVDEVVNDLSAPPMQEGLSEEESITEMLDDEFDELDMIEDLAPKLNDGKAMEEEIGKHVAETTVSWMDEKELEEETMDMEAEMDTIPGMNKIEESAPIIGNQATQEINDLSNEDELDEAEETNGIPGVNKIEKTIENQDFDILVSITDEDELEEDELELEAEDFVEDEIESKIIETVEAMIEEDELEEDERQVEGVEDEIAATTNKPVEVLAQEEEVIETVSSMNLIDSLLEETEEEISASIEEPKHQEEAFFTKESLDKPFWAEEIEEEQSLNQPEAKIHSPEKVAEELFFDQPSTQEDEPENAILADISTLASDLTTESEQSVEDLTTVAPSSNILEESLLLPILTDEEEKEQEKEWDDEIPHAIPADFEGDSPIPLAKKTFSSWSKHQSEAKEKAKLKKKKKKAKKKAAKLAAAEKLKKEAKASRLAEKARLKKEAAAKKERKRLKEEAKKLAAAEKKALKKSKKKQQAEKVLQAKDRKLKKVEKAKKKKKKDPIIAFANLSIERSNEVISETFAKVLTMQGEYEEAIKMYEHLKLNIPEKSSYFAKKIKNIKKML